MILSFVNFCRWILEIVRAEEENAKEANINGVLEKFKLSKIFWEHQGTKKVLSMLPGLHMHVHGRMY